MEAEEVEVECCPVCLDMLNQPMSCLTCKKYVCRAHAVALTKCPSCRAQPFAPVLDAGLEEKLAKIRAEKRLLERDTAKFQCHGKNCKFSGDYKQMVEHHGISHPYLSLNMVIYGDYEEIEDKDPVQHATQEERAKAAYAVNNLKRPPAGQRKKTVNFFQALRMIRHCNICPHSGCFSLYSGPWGSFIGGVMGRTHFDLTDCPKGKAMNVTAGWSYADPTS